MICSKGMKKQRLKIVNKKEKKRFRKKMMFKMKKTSSICRTHLSKSFLIRLKLSSVAFSLILVISRKHNYT